MTKQEATYQIQKVKEQRIFHHKEMLRIHGPAKGLTDKQWNSMEVKVKGPGSKGRGFANNRLWGHHDLEAVNKMKFE